MAAKPDLADVLARFDSLLQRIEGLLPPAPPPTDW
ncbi:MAG: AAA family ATPase, partial [Alphaproteobacteria bacterium]|nr:AAA family ATPase [Alphaproteobacteria bacterium]